ncbi:hypothetical protein QJQ45_009593 [Haematococcus lacustris]|nr:hypothetical protein QJQ45_009593 [Haematococcus lacustris]
MSRVAVIHAISEPSPEWQLQAALWYLFSFASQAAADRLGLHRTIMLGGLVLGVTLRCLLLLNQSFAYVLVVVVVAQMCSSGVCVLADAAVVSACSMEGQYGKLRKWGAVGWGAMSAVAGAVMGLWGMTAAFGLHFLLALPCLRFGYALHTPQPSLPPPPTSARRSHAVHHRPTLETVLEEKEEDAEEEEEEEKEEEQDNDWDTEAGQDQAVPLLRATELSRLPRSPPRSSAPTQAAAGQLPDTAPPTVVQLSTLTLQTKGKGGVRGMDVLLAFCKDPQICLFLAMATVFG